MATAVFDLQASIGGASAALGPKAEEDGVITQEGTLNTGHDGTVFSGGGTADAVFDFDTADEEDNYAVGDYVSLYWASGASATFGGTVTVVDTVDHRVTFIDSDGAAPANTTVCRLVKHTTFSFDFIGADVVAFAALIPSGLTNALVAFFAAGVEQDTLVLTAGLPRFWIEDMGLSNALAALTSDEMSFVTYDAIGTERIKFALIQDNLVVN